MTYEEALRRHKRFNIYATSFMCAWLLLLVWGGGLGVFSESPNKTLSNGFWLFTTLLAMSRTIPPIPPDANSKSVVRSFSLSWIKGTATLAVVFGGLAVWMHFYFHDGSHEEGFSFINLFGRIFGIVASIMLVGGYGIVSHRLRLFAKYSGDVHATTPSEAPATASAEPDAESETPDSTPAEDE